VRRNLQKKGRGVKGQSNEGAFSPGKIWKKNGKIVPGWANYSHQNVGGDKTKTGGGKKASKNDPKPKTIAVQGGVKKNPGNSKKLLMGGAERKKGKNDRKGTDDIRGEKTKP